MPKVRRRKKKKTWPTAIDLFSGCGGLTTGLKKARFRVLAAVEKDELAATTYRRNHRGVRIWQKDIRRLSVREVKRTLRLRRGQLDLLAGCPPCQGFSPIRRLNGARYVRDKQNALLFEFLRFVKVLRPRTVMLENVPGLAKYWRFPDFLKRLGRLGYEFEKDVLDAADFGVPQRRRRFILVASRMGRRPTFAPAAPDDRLTVRDAIGNLAKPGRTGDPCHDVKEKRTEDVKKLIRKIPQNGGSRAALGRRAQLDCHKTTEGFHDIYGRMPWDDVAPTITGGCVNPSKGRFLHPSQHRAITPREAAILQGFDPGYFFSLAGGKYKAAQMIGNALPPEFIRRHAVDLRRHLR